MPNAACGALRDGHLLSAELHASGSRWYALQHDCLVAPVRQARERLRRDVTADASRAAEVPVDHLPRGVSGQWPPVSWHSRNGRPPWRFWNP